jgi:O-antigen ligase
MIFSRWRDRLTLLIVALLPWQARYVKEPAELAGVPWERGTSSLFVLEVLLLLALLAHVLSASKADCERGEAPAPFRTAALLVLYAAFSVFWGYDTIAGLFSWFHLFDGFALAYLIWASKPPLKALMAAFVVGCLGSGLIGLWQFFTQSVAPSTLLGISGQEAYEPGVSVVESAAGRMLRAYGTLPHPNIFGGFMAMGLLAAAALAADARSPRARRAALAVIAVLAAALIASFSRSAWLGAALAALAAWTAVRRGLAEERARAFRTALIAFAAAAVMLVAVWPMAATRLSGDGRLERKSFEERQTTADMAIGLFLRHYAFGVGIGNAEPVIILEDSAVMDAYAVQPPHFVPLAVAAELGFFGVAVLVGAAAAWLADARRMLRRGRGVLPFLAALPIPIVVAGLFDHYPYTLFAGTMLSGFAFGAFFRAQAASTEA